MSNQVNIPIPIAHSQNPQQSSKEYMDEKTPYEIVNLPSSINAYDSTNTQIKRKDVSICKLRLQYLITFFLFFIIIFDVYIQINYGFTNYFGMIDNVLVFFLVLKLFYMCFKKQNFYGNRLSIVISVIILFGFCLKGFSLAFCMMKEDVNLLILYSFFIGLRTFGLIWLFPFTCRK